ncbi:MAG: hypothetical protein DMD31_00180 [Gemmatimonadetes bacterium]|nr:MAG: hypothetical protein DMD31_00180 [Gemmatimonadota bacterium]
MEGRLDMFLTRSLTAVLLVIALSLSACAAFDFYPSPRPIDLAVGQDEGLIYQDWDGGYPLRLVAFVLNPIGVVADLLFNQTAYNLFALDSELFGYTNQDELYRRDFRRYRYSWPSFGAQWSAY